MPSASRAPTPVRMDLESSESRYPDLDNQTVGFKTNKQEASVAP